MQKLIELLNEYEIWKTKDKISQNPKRSRRERYRGQLGSIFGTLMNERESRLSIISKSYGFIKRLVENDKIDIDKVIDTAKSSVIDTYYYEEGIDDIYIPLLMVLAVKDNPIEYLLSVIK